MKQGKNSPQALLDEGACVYGAGVLLKHLQALVVEVEGVRSGSEDIEFIHRTRVATRRLRAAIPLFETCLPGKKAKTWQKQIRTVTRALGEARDADVQIERLQAFQQDISEERFQPGVRRMLLRWHQKRESLQGPVVAAMDDLVESGTLEEMSRSLEAKAGQVSDVYIYTPSLYQHSFHSIVDRLDALLAYDAIVSLPEKVTELHEMRIAAKWLRYTMENFAQLYATNLKSPLQVTRKVQELLGDIHDSDIWIMTLSQFLEEERLRIRDYYGHERYFKRLVPGVEFFAADRKHARDAFYEDFTCRWEEWKREDIWGTLRRTIHVPFPQPESIYPPPQEKPGS